MNIPLIISTTYILNALLIHHLSPFSHVNFPSSSLFISPLQCPSPSSSCTVLRTKVASNELILLNVVGVLRPPPTMVLVLFLNFRFTLCLRCNNYCADTLIFLCPSLVNSTHDLVYVHFSLLIGIRIRSTVSLFHNDDIFFTLSVSILDYPPTQFISLVFISPRHATVTNILSLFPPQKCMHSPALLTDSSEISATTAQ